MQIHAFFVFLPWKTEIEALIKQKPQKLYCPDSLGQEYCRQILVYDKNSIHHKHFDVEFLLKNKPRDLSLRFIISLKP